MTQAVEQLQQLGFSQYESQAYVALLQQNPLNGYELAKSSGVPRANIYSVLQKLEERGAVLRIENPEGIRYSPVKPKELVSRLKGQYERDLEAAQGALVGVEHCEAGELVRNARGYPVMLEYAQSVIDSAQEELLVANYPPEAQVISDAIGQAEERGVAITTLCLQGCPHPCEHCKGQVFRYQAIQPGDPRFLVIIPDQKEMVAAEITTEKDALVVRTRQQMLVNLASWYIRNHISLAAILVSLGDRIGTLLDPNTLTILSAIGSENKQIGWFDYLHRLLKSKQKEEETHKNIGEVNHEQI